MICDSPPYIFIHLKAHIIDQKHFCRSNFAAWSSGVGASGLAAALTYSALIQAGIDPKVTLLIMLIVPICQSIR